jgi:hypothetical protein
MFVLRTAWADALVFSQYRQIAASSSASKIDAVLLFSFEFTVSLPLMVD